MARDADLVEAEALLAAIKPGQVWRLNFGKRDFRNRRIHVRGIIDEHVIVICEWSYRKKRWFYQTESVWFFFYNKERLIMVKN